MLRPLEGRVGLEDQVGFLGGLAREARIDVAQIDDAQLRDAVLLVAEELAGAADVEIALGQGEAVERLAVLALGHRGEPLGSGGIVADEHRVRPLLAAADAPAQLVELCEPEPLRPEDDHHRRVRDVDADLDDGRRDEHVQLAIGERAHRRVALLRRHAAVQEREPHSLERAGAKLLVRLDGARRALFTISRVDPRRHDERLLAGSDVLAHPGPDLRQGIGRPDLGPDVLPARRQLGKDREVQIAIDGLGQGARDRRRGREQEVRVDPLLAERRALAHTEAVLLVHDREPELLERHAVHNERVRADDDVEGAVREPDEDLAPIGRADARREEPHGRPAVREERRERAEVLLGEELGRRHERGLGTRCDRDPRRERGDDGLPRPDVALEKPRHRDRPPHICADLGEGLLLAVRERERQPRKPALEVGVRGGELRSLRVLLPTRATLREPELQREQLVEREPAAALEQARLGRGEVDLLQRVGQRQQLAARADRCGQSVRHLVDHGRALRRALDRGVQPPAEVALLQSVGEAVHRDHPAGMHALGVRGLDLRIGELQCAAEPGRLPR